jgi:hypothetical protein
MFHQKAHLFKSWGMEARAKLDICHVLQADTLANMISKRVLLSSCAAHVIRIQYGLAVHGHTQQSVKRKDTIHHCRQPQLSTRHAAILRSSNAGNCQGGWGMSSGRIKTGSLELLGLRHRQLEVQGRASAEAFVAATPNEERLPRASADLRSSATLQAGLNIWGETETPALQMMECIEKVGVYRPAVPGLATGMWLEMFAGVKEQMGLFQDLYVALIANKVTAGRKCISNLLRGLPASDSAADIVRLAAWPEQL